MNNRWNRRKTLVLWLVIAVVFLAAVCIGGLFCEDAAKATDFSRKNIAPCMKYPFGTDWLGRDMFARTVRGLSISIIIGVCAATFSAVMAFILGGCICNNGKNSRYHCDMDHRSGYGNPTYASSDPYLCRMRKRT